MNGDLYLHYHIMLMGKAIFHNGVRIYKHQVIPLLISGQLDISDIEIGLKGWKMFDKPGWINGEITDIRLASKSI